jgi:NAD(P)-dependent dehydrogenase (short-subunit alcohol dehydrogenase family)
MSQVLPPPIVLVTGASSGIGALTADLFAARGLRVFGTSRRPGAGRPGIELLPLDVDDDDSVRSCLAEIERRRSTSS